MEIPSPCGRSPRGQKLGLTQPPTITSEESYFSEGVYVPCRAPRSAVLKTTDDTDGPGQTRHTAH